MTALDNIDHAAVGHVIEMVRVEPNGGAFPAFIDGNVNHGLFFVGVEFLHGQERKPCFGLLTGQRKTTGAYPALIDAVRDRLCALGRESRITRCIVAEVAGGDINRTAADQRGNAQ